MKTRKETAELAALLGERNPGSPACNASNALIMCRIASAAQRIAVDLCNGDIEQHQFEKRKTALLHRLSAFEAPYKIRFEIGGDPRGYVTRISSTSKQPIRGNTWGGDEEGYGI